MLNKLYIIIVIFLACGWGFTHWSKIAIENDFERLETNYNALMGNKIFLEKEIERRNKIEIQTSERLQELSRLAEEEKNKGGFDWSSPLPANDSVVIRLRKN